ncbi:hypothetical protein EV179_004204 [Coemansia sp. RSA 487]|nr:hypothetical protein EV179_004204 [Coemansia sp. RSA 487]
MATHLKLYTRPIYFDDGYPSLQNFSGLTHLDYDYKDNGEFAGYLIQRSAPTLEVLKVTRFLMNLVKHLVLRDDNTPIEYPRLQKLFYLENVHL